MSLKTPAVFDSSALSDSMWLNRLEAQPKVLYSAAAVAKVATSTFAPPPIVDEMEALRR